jgi:hypothetical protein
VITEKHNDENANTEKTSTQLLHLVFGGELTDLAGVTFRNLNKLDVVGIFQSYAAAYAVWKAKAQHYFIVHLHRLLVPDHD